MGLEFQGEVAVLGKFGEACEGSLLDWRKKCFDEIVMRIPLVLVDQFFADLPYLALVDMQTSINFREAWEEEGGTDNPNCCPSTANSQTEICEFKLPNLQNISIGTEPECYQDLRKRLCRKYPIFKKCSPFRVVGGQIQTLDRLGGDGTTAQASRTFAHYINSDLSQAIWNHLYETVWTGRDSKVDSFNGIFYYLENGITDLKVTDCDYPTQPQKVDWATIILGTAAAAAGGLAAPGDVVTELDDPNRPGDVVPADNILVIHSGTSCETSLDITGMNLIDIMTAWYEYLTDQWNINVSSWLLGMPRGKTKCFSEVAACQQACRGGDCRHLLIGDNRDAGRAERESDFVRNKVIELWPYDVRIPMYQSPALDDTNRILFIPETFTDRDGESSSWLMWTMLNQRQENESMFADVPALREALGLTGARLGLTDFDGERNDGSEFNFATGPLVDSTVWDWHWQKDCNAVRWWNTGSMGLVPQCPWLWMCIDGVDCSKTITLECCNWPNSVPEWDLLSCTETAAPVGYTSSIELTIDDNSLAAYTVGDTVDYLTGVGTTYRGIVLVYTAGDPSTIEIGFVDDTVTCASSGGSTAGSVRDGVGV